MKLVFNISYNLYFTNIQWYFLKSLSSAIDVTGIYVYLADLKIHNKNNPKLQDNQK